MTETVALPGVSAADLAQIYRLAEAAFPRECCGFILAGGIRPAVNVIDRLHAADPASFERSAETGYALGPRDAIFLETSFDTDDPVLVLYHSHPNGRAYFSDEDTSRALFNGRPVYPGLLQLVVGVNEDGAQEAGLFRFEDGAFRETGRHVVTSVPAGP